MIDTIFIGMSGLSGYSSGLRVIANNTANLNTPGFKSSTMQFTDMFYSAGGGSGGPAGTFGAQFGFGLSTTTAALNFRQGELRQTGNEFDLAVNGQGLFLLRDEGSAELRYTRAGQFEFNADGLLVNRADGAHVMARSASGTLSDINISELRMGAPKATGAVAFAGNLSSTEASAAVSGVKVIDANGAEHLLSLNFSSQSTEQAGRWKIKLSDGSKEVGTATIDFTDGKPTAETSKPSFSYTPSGQPEMTIVLDFSDRVTSFASGTLSTLAAASQDGFVAAAISKVGFDDKGVMQLEYTNGQKTQGPRLALARFDSPELLLPLGGNAFKAVEGAATDIGVAGTGAFGALRSGTVEISNVDLSQEFSDLVIMQRGYQASSQVISTANEMLQELFGMRGR